MPNIKRRRTLLIVGVLGGIVSFFSCFALVFNFLFGNMAGASTHPLGTTYYVVYTGTFAVGTLIFVLCKRLAKKEE